MRWRRDAALVGAAFALCPLAAALAPADPADPLARAGAVAFAVLVGASVAALVRSRALRAVAVAYPVLVTAVVIATANHLWADAVAGLSVAAAGGALAVIGRTAAPGASVRAGERGRTRRE